MQKFNKKISVIYLAWGGLPIETVKRFFASYEKYASGYPHELLIISREYEGTDYALISAYASKYNAHLLKTENTGQDFGAYYTGAKLTDSDYILCMNSHSVIMCDDWILKLIRAKEKYPQMELIGYGGSWQKSDTYFEYYNEQLKKRYKIKNLVYHMKKNFIRFFNLIDLLSNIQRFPNYNVRTHAFFINKKIYIDFIEKECKNRLPHNKVQAYRMETGNHSLSRYVLKLGYDYCVVGRNSEIYRKEDFDKSGTWSSLFENYIIQDKQIRIYEALERTKQKILERRVWGVSRDN